MRQLIEYDTFKDKNGRTRREDLQAFGEDDLIPEPVELSLDDCKRLDLYFSISRLRKPAMSGIMPLGAEEIKGWEALMHVELTELEIDLVLTLDRQYRVSMGRQQELEAQANAPSPSNKRYGEL